MFSKFFYLTLGFSVVIWILTKSIGAGLLPIIVYVIIRVLINLLLLIEGEGQRV